MCNTQAVTEFDNWINCNYQDLIKYCKKYRINEDILPQVYLNIRDRIERLGYSGDTFMTYIKHSITFYRINEAKKNNNKHFIDFQDEDYTISIDNKLLNEDYDEKKTREYRENVMYLSKMLFIYLNKKEYPDDWQFVFRCYYLMEEKMTYSKLRDMTGINKNKCTTIIQTMKKDIKENFQTFLNDESRRSNSSND